MVELVDTMVDLSTLQTIRTHCVETQTSLIDQRQNDKCAGSNPAPTMIYDLAEGVVPLAFSWLIPPFNIFPPWSSLYKEK